MRDVRTLKLVIPAQAGIHSAVDDRKMDPRFRGDDMIRIAVAHLSKAGAAFRRNDEPKRYPRERAQYRFLTY